MITIVCPNWDTSIVKILMLEIGEIIKSNWVSSCIINTGRLNLTGVFWLTCMTGVLILEWRNRWKMAFGKERGVICFTAKVFFSICSVIQGYQVMNSRIKKREMNRSQGTVGMTDKFWDKSGYRQQRKAKKRRNNLPPTSEQEDEDRVIHVISCKTSWRSEKGKGGIAQCKGLCVYVLCTLKNSMENVSLNCYCRDWTEKDTLA